MPVLRVGLRAWASVTKVTARPCRYAAVGLAMLVLVCGARRVAAQAGSCEQAQTQAELNRCASESSHRAGQRLADLLRDLPATLDSIRLPGLDSAQVDWERFRHSHCGWEASGYAGGSMQPMVLSACWAAVTERRIEELKVFLCNGQEPSCPESRRYDQPRRPRHRQ